MEKATETIDSRPIATADEQMHYLFEIQLMTDQIVAEGSAGNLTDYAWMVKTQHVRRYLVNYYREHGELPAGHRYLGMTRPLNLEVGMVNFDVIRQKIRVDSEFRQDLNVERRRSIEDVTEHGLRGDTEPAMQAQGAGREQSEVIVDLRQALARRGKKR